jgi:N-acetylglutamate synthase-like GNAT family acetyltransferase
MQIRPALPHDKPAIIELLKSSLGESTIPKSESLWNWKHEQNPFGQSFVLVAEENNTIIGVRAFMQWQWLWNQHRYQAIRAVDTATHPGHQGKGIFKKLTLQQLELCKQQGVHFVFNTPNEQSRPGYLKMGWVQQGKMPLKLSVLRPLALAYARFFNKNKFQATSEDPSPKQIWDPVVFQFANRVLQPSQQLCTALSPDYIGWRFANNPLFRYNYITDHENFLLITRIKNQSFTRELRLVEFLVTDSANVTKVNAYMKKAVHAFCREHHINIVSLSGQQYRFHQRFFSWMGFIPVKNWGPIITVRDLNMNEHFNGLLQTNNWYYSLGDMELF